MKEGLKMASFKFDSKKFMRELEKDVKKSIQQDLSRHPEKVLNDHVGECVDVCCPHCDNPQMEVLSGGFVRCPACGFTDRAKIELNWK